MNEKERVIWIDMFKAILTLLVIVGHFVLKWVPSSEGEHIFDFTCQHLL